MGWGGGQGDRGEGGERGAEVGVEGVGRKERAREVASPSLSVFKFKSLHPQRNMLC